MRRAKPEPFEAFLSRLLRMGARALFAELEGSGTRPRGFQPSRPMRVQDPASYSVLGVLPSAPKEVVEAAYRAWVKLLRPDLDRNKAEFQQIARAMEAIRKERGWKT